VAAGVGGASLTGCLQHSISGLLLVRHTPRQITLSSTLCRKVVSHLYPGLMLTDPAWVTCLSQEVEEVNQAIPHGLLLEEP
jgi:hypothetical protein